MVASPCLKKNAYSGCPTPQRHIAQALRDAKDSLILSQTRTRQTILFSPYPVSAAPIVLQDEPGSSLTLSKEAGGTRGEEPNSTSKPLPEGSLLSPPSGTTPYSLSSLQIFCISQPCLTDVEFHLQFTILLTFLYFSSSKQSPGFRIDILACSNPKLPCLFFLSCSQYLVCVA